MVGIVAMGKAGLGSFPKPRYGRTHGKEKRQLVQDEICAEIEEDCCSKMVNMSKQWAWTRWEHAEPRKFTWAVLWRAEHLCTKFLIQSVYDVIIKPSQRRGTLEHILSYCSKALGDGRYRWCHDQILKQQDPDCPEAVNHLH